MIILRRVRREVHRVDTVVTWCLSQPILAPLHTTLWAESCKTQFPAEDIVRNGAGFNFGLFVSKPRVGGPTALKSMYRRQHYCLVVLRSTRQTALHKDLRSRA